MVKGARQSGSFEPSSSGSTHFARVRPVVGDSLGKARIALFGLPQAAPLVTYLAASGVGRWLWAKPRDGSEARLRADLRAQHGTALPLDVVSVPPGEWGAALRAYRPDLLLAVGGPADDRHRHRRAAPGHAGSESKIIFEAAMGLEVPVLLITPPTASRPCQATVVFPGDALPGEEIGRDPTPGPPDPWGWASAAPLCAGLARAILLRETPCRRTDLTDVWNAGVRLFTFADPTDPFAVACFRPGQMAAGTPSPPLFRTPERKRGVLLIVGLGSLGSVAAMHLASYVAEVVVVDPDEVSPYNPVRQAYPVATLGQPKAFALRDRLLRAGVGRAVAIPEALRDEGRVAALVGRYEITAALVSTGTDADFPIARALRACDVPHVVGRCYPRARYWEAILVDGRLGPAFEDIRGHLRLGPMPPPTPEQVAAYSDAGALEAEPATLVESGWAAAWLARLTAQMLAPPGLRERWLLELLATERTCLVGGVGVEQTPDGPAYGVALPGAIHAWELAQVRSSFSLALI